MGDDRRLGEHHRGLLAGPGRLARVRLPAARRESGSVTDAGAPQPIELARPEIGPREEELVLEVLRSGRLSLGPIGARFERELAAWLGVEDAVAASSGTAALHLGVRQLGWGRGDEVVTSPFSFVASANCLLYEGARPVFCDVDPVTLNLDPEAAAAAVGERTAGVLPVHIFGYPAAMPELERLAGGRGLGILEDACEALGAVDSEGRRVGARGNLATFAFYANKQMTTGEGGMIVPADPDTAARLRSERNQGRAVDMGWLDHDRLGYNYRLSDVAAAVGVAQVEKLDDLLGRRAAVAALYSERLAELEGVELPIAGRGREVRSWFVYVVRLPDEVDRDTTITRLAARGVASKAYLPCIHLFPHLRELGYREGQFPVAEAAAARSLALPFYPSLGEAEVDRVCAELAAAIRSGR
ncbi:MAG: DegT/DnrJ/EryC1/StrS family aminotransferase [Actinobacteria bacterium]|nr:DegT/DnrJ/EryC1/StrS family aminotransferase [Actinomycetota bacterium]